MLLAAVCNVLLQEETKPWTQLHLVLAPSLPTAHTTWMKLVACSVKPPAGSTWSLATLQLGLHCDQHTITTYPFAGWSLRERKGTTGNMYSKGQEMKMPALWIHYITEKTIRGGRWQGKAAAAFECSLYLSTVIILSTIRFWKISKLFCYWL